MLPKFKMASRTADELKTAKQELNDMIIELVRGPGNRLNPRGVAKLNTPDLRMEVAELIVQLIQDDVTTSDPLPLLVEEVDGDIRNQYIFQQMTAALRVQARAYGSKPLSQRLTFKEFSISTIAKEVNVELPLEEIASGRVTPAMAAEQMAFAISRYRIANTLNALDAGVASVADRTGKSGYTLRYIGLTKANLDHALDGLYDETDSVAIMGRHVAMYPGIDAFAGWSQQSLYGLETKSQLGVYRGAPIIALKDGFSKVTGDHVIRNDRVYIAGAEKGAKYMSKDLSFLNYAVVDERTATFATGIRIEDGLLVWDPFRYRVIES